jgi:hypothetical protein
VRVPIGGLCSTPLASIGQTLTALSVDAYSVSPSRGWVLALSTPCMHMHVNTISGAPWCAHCAQSCVEPFFIGSLGRSSPKGLVAVPVHLRVAVSPIPSITVVIIESAAGGGAVTSSGHRVLFRFRI